MINHILERPLVLVLFLIGITIGFPLASSIISGLTNNNPQQELTN